MDYPIQGSYQNLADNPTYAETQELTQELIKQFNDKNIDRVEIVYHHFKSKGSIILTRKIFLPMVDLIQNEKQPGIYRRTIAFGIDFNVIAPFVVLQYVFHIAECRCIRTCHTHDCNANSYR